MLLSLQDTIRTHQLSANKKLGQHFLTDEQLLAKIVQTAALAESTHVIEVGPGPGGLTRALLQEDHIASVTALELDARCVRALQSLVEASAGKLQVIETDALKMSLEDLTPAPRAVVANLPYNVGTQMVIAWLKLIYDKGAAALDSITVMLQKEVVERMVAAPDCKDYGRLSVLCQWLCDVDYCFDVPPEAFSPPPAVMSSVVRLAPRSQPLFNASWQEVESFLHIAFNQRRKMLRKTLTNWHADAVARMESCGIDPTRRAETLSLQEIGQLLLIK